MIKSPKVKKLIDQNGIEVQNFTMVIRLKKIIQQLNLKIKSQDQAIMTLKRDTKTTKINQMEVQIQHLNDQNKRLTLMIEEMKNKYNKEKIIYSKILSGNSKASECQQFIKSIESNKTKTKKKKSCNKKDADSSLVGSIFNFSSSLMMNIGHKKSYPQTEKQKQQLMRHQLKEKKFQNKYYQLLEQTQKLKKELINIRINEPNSLAKKRKSLNSNDKSNVLLQKNMQSIERITQKKHDLQAQNELIKKKVQQMQKRSKQLETSNQETLRLVQQLKNEIKCKKLLSSQKTLTLSKSPVFKDVSNSILNHPKVTTGMDKSVVEHDNTVSL